LIAVLALVGCTASQPAPEGRYRAANAPIYSNAVLQVDRLAGDWAQVAAFASENTSCPPSGLKITAGLDVTGQLCLSGKVIAVAGTLRPAGPGRFSLNRSVGGGLGQTWWVLWADVGYRTLAIGTPSGDFGFILNRDGALPSDRQKAAAEVLAFNGYDPAQLRIVPVR
jgi:apolipoprotein D and lipocalin family protein